MYHFALDQRLFFDIDHFIHHNQNYHYASTFVCPYCTQSIELLKAKLHLRLHSVNDFQCLFCSFSATSLDQITNHLSIQHPEKLQLVAVRKYRRNMSAVSVS